MKSKNDLHRCIMLLLQAVGLLFLVGVYGYYWFYYYSYQIQLSFWNRGHWLVISIYAILLFFFMNMYGGLKIGYYRKMEVLFSQIFAVICVNLITYLQVALMALGFVVIQPFLRMCLIQFAGSAVWTYLSGRVYRRIYKPRQMLLVHGDRPIESILEKFATRRDKYNICKCIQVAEGHEAVCQEIDKGYDAIVLWDMTADERNRLWKYCFSKSIRVYAMPKIPDVILKGADQLHLFDTPILLTREYVLTVEQRAAKRVIDIVCSLVLLMITSPIMVITAISIKLYDNGPVFYKQIRCTLNQREFKILKFRSMRVDAEKDGVARLAAKDDKRITPIGRFIRAVRIDELPQLLNIIAGDMTFIGPRPERPEIIAKYMQEMPEFALRMKVKAGLAGYAQVYGKYNTTPYDKLKLDLFYMQNYSVWLDVKLMLLTLKILFKPESTEGVEEQQTTALK